MQNLKWATAHLSIRLGAGAQAGRWTRGGRWVLGAQGYEQAWRARKAGTQGACGGKARHGEARREGARVLATTRPARPATRHRVRVAWEQYARDLCALAGPGWVLCAPDSVLTQFLDSVLLLSHFLGTVHEHCS